MVRAGVARVALELPLKIPLMGYGARQGLAESVHDPLHARALYLESDGRALVVTLDVCLLAVPQARALRERVAARTGLPVSAVWVAATHTHSGPETGIADVLAGRPKPDWVAPLEDAAVRAAAVARAAAAPARLGLGRAETAIGRNRRAPGGAVDRELVVLRVDDAAGAPRAVAFVHGTHPTVLGHENLAFSADWPGEAMRAVEAAFPGATALFLLGGHGDVDPRTRGLQDLAVAGQSAGAGFDAVRVLGGEAGRAVAGAARAIATRDDVPVRAASVRRRLAVQGADAGPAGLARRAEAAARAVGLDPRGPVRVSQVLAREREGTEGLPVEAVRDRLAQVRLFVRDRTAARVAGGAHPEVEAQVLRLGDAAWLGVPAEADAALSLAWKAAQPPGSALCSIVGGWLRYLPHPDRFREARAHHHYEVLMATLEPGAGAALLEAGAAAARETGGP